MFLTIDEGYLYLGDISGNFFKFNIKENKIEKCFKKLMPNKIWPINSDMTINFQLFTDLKGYLKISSIQIDEIIMILEKYAVI